MNARNEAYGAALAFRHTKKGLDLPVSSGVGVTTMFSVLLVLCITVFAVLSFASAQADRRLTEKNAEMVSAFYKADNAATRISAEVTRFWPQGTARPNAGKIKELEDAIRSWDAEIAYVSATDTGNGISVSYGIGADALLTLDVGLFLPEGGVCEVLYWQLAAEENELGAQQLPVWQGN